MAPDKNKKLTITYKDDLGKRIRMFRLKKGLMQGQLGRLVGVSANGVTNWEKGLGHPTAVKIISLCAALDITPDQLFGIPSRDSRLTGDEQRLLETYRDLPSEDREVALDMLDSFRDRRASQQAEKDKAWYFSHFLRISKNSLKVSAGTGEYLWDHRGLGYVYLKRDELTESADEIITVHGDSMEPRLHDGDDLLVEHTSSIDYGETGIFIIEGEGLVKEYRPEGLYSVNSSKYPLIPARRLSDCVCMGRVLGVITPDMRAGQEDRETLKKLFAEEGKNGKR